MAPSVALITGASSGIGLALTKHLISKGWRVVLADLNPPPSSASLPAEQTLFIKCDVCSWDEQASLFRRAFDWAGRLDFCALNAGIDDRDDIFNSVDPSTPPCKPSMKTFDVDLYAVYYGVKLAAHYFSRNPAGEHGPAGGTIIMTASAAALYPHHAIPQYSAAKAALVGLTRALAPQATKRNVAVNALCPAFVPGTALAPPGLVEGYKGEITPMATILRAYDELMGVDERGARRSGKVCLASGERLVFVDEQMERDAGAVEELGNADIWEKVYVERNVGFARMQDNA